MQTTYSQAASSHPARSRWRAGRITALTVASLVLLIGLAALGGGGTALVYDQWKRDADDYLMSSTHSYSTDTYALVSDSYHAGTSGPRGIERDVVGRFRVRSVSDRPVFVGIASSAAVGRYLSGVRRDVATRLYAGPSDYRVQPGGAPAGPPAAQHLWAAQTVGAGTQTLSWMPESGRWRIVVMNADGSAGVGADLAIGARFPHLLSIGLGSLGVGLVLVVLGGWWAIRVVRPRRSL